MFDWLRSKKTLLQQKEENEHPFDKAYRQVNDDIASLRRTSEDLEEREDKRIARQAMKRIDG